MYSYFLLTIALTSYARKITKETIFNIQYLKKREIIFRFAYLAKLGSKYLSTISTMAFSQKSSQRAERSAKLEIIYHFFKYSLLFLLRICCIAGEGNISFGPIWSHSRCVRHFLRDADSIHYRYKSYEKICLGPISCLILT